MPLYIVNEYFYKLIIVEFFMLQESQNSKLENVLLSLLNNNTANEPAAYLRGIVRRLANNTISVDAYNKTVETFNTLTHPENTDLFVKLLDKKSTFYNSLEASQRKNVDQVSGCIDIISEVNKTDGFRSVNAIIAAADELNKDKLLDYANNLISDNKIAKIKDDLYNFHYDKISALEAKNGGKKLNDVESNYSGRMPLLNAINSLNEYLKGNGQDREAIIKDRYSSVSEAMQNLTESVVRKINQVAESIENKKAK